MQFKIFTDKFFNGTNFSKTIKHKVTNIKVFCSIKFSLLLSREYAEKIPVKLKKFPSRFTNGKVSQEKKTLIGKQVSRYGERK